MSERAPSRGAFERLSMLSAIGFESEPDYYEGNVTLMAGEPNLYGVYESSKEQVFDSDETFQHHSTPNMNGDIVINNAEKFLRLVVGDRKILLESEVDVLPASFRVELSVRDQFTTSTAQTRELVENLISGASLRSSKAAEADLENFQSGVYINEFIEVSNEVCRLTENMLDAYQPAK